jgi:FkbM family methyltransferase
MHYRAAVVRVPALDLYEGDFMAHEGKGTISAVRDRVPESLRAGVKSLVTAFGYDIRRLDSYFHKRPIDFIRSRDIDLVVDVGANIGQYAASLRKDGYKGWIVSAEPVGAVYDVLADHAAGDQRWKTFNVAFGETDGQAEINVSECSVFSSIRQQLPAATAFMADAKVIGCEAIKVRRLDNVFGELPGSRPFLKIDTQGYEQQVLMGASACLSKFLGVQMELPIIQLYEGCWRFHEAVAFMSERGFEISNIVPVNYDTVDAVSLVEVDCIFRARDR